MWKNDILQTSANESVLKKKSQNPQAQGDNRVWNSMTLCNEGANQRHMI